MADNTVVGGKCVDVFRLTDTGSAYAPKKLDGTTSATAATDRMVRLSLAKDLTFKPNEDGTSSLTMDQDKDDNEWIDMLNAVAHTAVSAANTVKISERLYMGGTKRFGDTAATLNLCLLNFYGSADLDDTTKMKFFSMIGYFKRTTGGFKHAADSTSAPNVDFVGVVTKYDYDAIALVDGATGYVDKTATSAWVIPASIGFKQRHVTIKT